MVESLRYRDTAAVFFVSQDVPLKPGRQAACVYRANSMVDGTRSLSLGYSRRLGLVSQSQGLELGLNMARYPQRSREQGHMRTEASCRAAPYALSGPGQLAAVAVPFAVADVG